MNYKEGDRVSWRAINRECTGTVTGFYRTFAVVVPDGSQGVVLLQNELLKTNYTASR